MKKVIQLIGESVGEAATKWIAHADNVVKDVSTAWPDAVGFERYSLHNFISKIHLKKVVKKVV
jgi:hypothetical protein